MVSPVSGQVYERRLIEKYVTETGVDPVNKEPLAIEQLIEVSQEFKRFSELRNYGLLLWAAPHGISSFGHQIMGFRRNMM